MKIGSYPKPFFPIIFFEIVPFIFPVTFTILPFGFLNERLKKVDLRISDRMIIQLKNKSDFLEENDV